MMGLTTKACNSINSGIFAWIEPQFAYDNNGQLAIA